MRCRTHPDEWVGPVLCATVEWPQELPYPGIYIVLPYLLNVLMKLIMYPKIQEEKWQNGMLLGKDPRRGWGEGEKQGFFFTSF